MNSAIRATRIKEIKSQFVKKKIGLSFTQLTEKQRTVAIIRMRSHCFTVSDQSRFTFEFYGNVLMRMIDHAVILENMLN